MAFTKTQITEVQQRAFLDSTFGDNNYSILEVNEGGLLVKTSSGAIHTINNGMVNTHISQQRGSASFNGGVADASTHNQRLFAAMNVDVMQTRKLSSEQEADIKQRTGWSDNELNDRFTGAINMTRQEHNANQRNSNQQEKQDFNALLPSQREAVERKTQEARREAITDATTKLPSER